jgi:hypothetical protein
MSSGRFLVGGLWGLAALGALACGDGGSRWTGTMTDSVGVQLVVNTLTGMWTDEQPQIADELTIGNAEGDPNYQFGAIAGIDVGSDGTIFVLDQQSRTVRAYDGQGQYLRTMGGPGSGPGELSPATIGLIVLRDTVLVPDMGQQRMTRYTSAGDVIGSFPIPFTEGLAVRWLERNDGRLVQQSRIMSFPGQPQVEPKDLLLVREADGTIIDTLLTLPAGKTFTATESSMSLKFFESEPVWTLQEDGSLWYAMNSDYSIQGHAADGTLKRIVRRAFERKPVTDEDKTAWLTMLKELMTTNGAPPQAVDQMMAMTSFAPNYPAFANLMAGPEGTLWVQQIITAEEAKAAGGSFNIQDMGSAMWDVFAADGRYLGAVKLPNRFAPVRVLGDQIYGVWRDDLDVQHVKRIRVTIPVPE